MTMADPPESPPSPRPPIDRNPWNPQDSAAAPPDRSPAPLPRSPRLVPLVLTSSTLTLGAMAGQQFWLGWLGALVTGLLALRLVGPDVQAIAQELLIDQWGSPVVGLLGLGVALTAIVEFTGWGDEAIALLQHIDWNIVSALGSVLGAAGQILIAVLAVYIAWRQYVISKALTIQQNLLTMQQNLITQQQTIDSYFQGVSDLVLDDEGLLEDWPQERAIAEGRTAAILSSIDGEGKAKVIRFLSTAKLLTPLQRDQHLGRAILDGRGGYAEDRVNGLRVIDLGVMLAKSDLSGTDLRWTDLSDLNLVSANLSRCDLVRTNLSRTILYEANLRGADLLGTRLFYGPIATASPRSPTEPPNYTTGEYTGAVVENADLTDVQRLSPDQHYYCCAWGGPQTRATIPGGCQGIPDRRATQN